MDENKTMENVADSVEEVLVDVDVAEEIPETSPKPGFTLPSTTDLGNQLIAGVVTMAAASIVKVGGEALVNGGSKALAWGSRKVGSLVTAHKEKRELKKAEKAAKKAIEEKNVQEQTEEVTQETEEN